MTRLAVIGTDNLVKEYIRKIEGQAEEIRYYNYPYEVFEELIGVNVENLMGYATLPDTQELSRYLKARGGSGCACVAFCPGVTADNLWVSCIRSIRVRLFILPI